jgi:MYXO-CTERM domain-containing protein
MRKAIVLGSSLLAWLGLASTAQAATWYVSPTGTATCGCATRDIPCDLAAAAAGAVAGDTVILMDGVYKKQLYIANSGTASAWITFKADDCSTPIIEGPGVAPDADNQDSGVSSTTATYVKLDGIVSRGWSTGFGNGWTGSKTPDSNGNWDIENCIGDMNGRTGFTFFSAQGFTLRHSISGHNGSSTAHSWSSGVTLYASPGGDIIDSNVSFENMDAEKHTDGSGFIADESSHGATFVNNLAFGNGGSCLRLTKTNSTKFINNTCYHDAQDSADSAPDDPDEVYFTNAPSDTTNFTGISFVNNVLVALGSGHGLKASNYTPTSGWSNNVTATGSVTYFTGAEGTHPDFTPTSGASFTSQGTLTGAPMSDLGFDPKCLVRRSPTMIGMMAKASWWQYSVDYDYIKSIGGVAKCFNPKVRMDPPGVGSYFGAPTASATGCMPPTTGGSGMGSVCTGAAGMGGMGSGGSAGSATVAGGAGGITSTGGTGNPGAGMSSVGGSSMSAGGVTATGGTTMTGAGGTGTGGTGTGGTGTGGTGTGGTGATTTAGGSAGTGTLGTGGSGTGTGGSSAGGTPSAGGTGTGSGATGGGAESAPSGCGCRVAAPTSSAASLAGFGLFGLSLLGLRRRRQSR